ncbi:unnamed protein product [Albugo candida]|uniref:Uncharacterized protein n=1 Tax=Albugo candida TaxID=65357 RepID=A0A024FUS7_9STRA|nr:unnamed protein product [Albugo candida]|eukprot:CCI10672.1 unnamed protein product [Albugo candida]
MRFSSFESVFSEYFSTCSSKHYDVDRFLRNRSAKMTVFPFSITDTLLVFDSEDAKWLEWEDLLALFRPSTVTPDNESMASVPGSNSLSTQKSSARKKEKGILRGIRPSRHKDRRCSSLFKSHHLCQAW